MKKLIFTIFLTQVWVLSFSQEFKLGLPVGPTSSISKIVVDEENQLIATKSVNYSHKTSVNISSVKKGTNDIFIFDYNSKKVIKKFIGIEIDDFGFRGEHFFLGNRNLLILHHLQKDSSYRFRLNSKTEKYYKLSNDCKTIVTYSILNKRFKVWDFKSQKLLYVEEGFSFQQLFPDDRHYITTSSTYLEKEKAYSYETQLRDLKSGKIKQRFEGNYSDFTKNSIELFSKNHNLITTESSYRGRFDTIFVWRIHEGELLGKFPGKNPKLHGDGRVLMTELESQVCIWDINSGKLITSFKGDYGKFVSNGELIEISKKDTLYQKGYKPSAEYGRKIFNYEGGEVLDLGYYSYKSDNQQFVAIPDFQNNKTKVIDISSPKDVKAIEGFYQMFGAKVLNDGKFIFYNKQDKSINLLDYKTGKLLFNQNGTIDYEIVSYNSNTILSIDNMLFEVDSNQDIHKKKSTSFGTRLSKLFPENIAKGYVYHTSTGGSIWIMDKNTGSIIKEIDGSLLSFAANDSTFLVLKEDSLLKMNNNSLNHEYSYKIPRSMENSTIRYISSELEYVVLEKENEEDFTYFIWFLNEEKTVKSTKATRFLIERDCLVFKDYSDNSTKIFDPENQAFTKYKGYELLNISSNKVITTDSTQTYIYDNQGKLLKSLKDFQGVIAKDQYLVFQDMNNYFVSLLNIDNDSLLLDDMYGNYFSLIEDSILISERIAEEPKDDVTYIYDILKSKYIGQLKGYFIGKSKHRIITFDEDGVVRVFSLNSNKVFNYKSKQTDGSSIYFGERDYNKVFVFDNYIVFQENDHLFSKINLDSLVVNKLIHGQFKSVNWDEKFIFYEEGGFEKILDIERSLIVQDDLIDPIRNSTGRLKIGRTSKGNVVLMDSSFNSIISLYIFDDDPKKWLHLTEDGYFDASPEAMEFMYWTKGLEVIEFSQLKDRFWIPGLWERVMKGEPLPVTNSRGLNDIDLYPKVELEHPMYNDGKLGIQLIDQGGGYGSVTILINGKEVSSDARGVDFDHSLDSVSLTYDIIGHPYLKQGEINTIEVSAYNYEEYVISRPKKLYYIPDGNKEEYEPTLHAIIVGSADYVGYDLDLSFPSKDAYSFSSSLELSAKNLLGSEKTNFRILTTDDKNNWPSKENIKKAYLDLGKSAKPYDAIVLYFAGHGTNYGGVDGDFYYLTADASNGNLKDPVIRESVAISSDELTEWIKVIPALKQVLIFDACHSGQFAEDLLAKRELRNASEVKALERMKDRTGMYILSGSAADAVSYEASVYGQGLLTYALLFGMKGASLREDKFVDVVQLFQFAANKVPELAEDIGGIQKPEIRVPLGGESFDIGLLESKDRELIELPNPKPLYIRSSFQNQDTFDDNLELSELLNEKLKNLQESRNPIVFVDASKFSNAYSIRGQYKQKGNKIQLQANLLKDGEVIKTFKIKAATKEQLVDKLFEEGLIEQSSR